MTYERDSTLFSGKRSKVCLGPTNKRALPQCKAPKVNYTYQLATNPSGTQAKRTGPSPAFQIGITRLI